MACEVEIDQLATELLGASDAEQHVSDALRAATEARQWDEVIKWNRVRWRMRMMLRRKLNAQFPMAQISAAP